MNKPSRHHILHDRVSWMASPESRELRTTHELIPRMPRELHSELHLACPPIPLLGRLTLRNTLKAFTPDHNPIVTVERLIGAIETQVGYGHEIEQQLAVLAMEALELQIPFLKQNQQSLVMVDLGAR